MFVFSFFLFQEKVWKQDRVNVFFFEWSPKSRYSRNLEKLTLMKASKENNYIYLPLQLSHLKVIQEFMPPDEYVQETFCAL